MDGLRVTAGRAGSFIGYILGLVLEKPVTGFFFSACCVFLSPLKPGSGPNYLEVFNLFFCP